MDAVKQMLKDKWRQIALAVGVLAVLAFVFVCFVNTSEGLTLWQFFTAIAAYVGIYYANRRAKAMDGTNEQKTYNDAVGNLGNEKSSVRLGGIYGLFDLAKSEYQRRRNITEILCAHLRDTTQNKKEGYQEAHRDTPSNEIQSLLNVLCELNEGNLKHEKTRDIRLNLEHSYLRGANLESKKLRWAELGGADLRGARLSGAELQGANLGGARLQGAFLWGAQLQGAHLDNARLQGANLGLANLWEANLWMAQLQGANLSNAKLWGATLWEAQLQGAHLDNARLQGADLSQVRIEEAKLMIMGAQLQGAHLDNARLQGAKLDGARLEGATAVAQGGAGEFGAPPGSPFEERVKSRVGKGADLESAVFSGGLTDEEITEIHDALAQLDKSKAEKLCAELRKNHLGKPKSYKPPEGADTSVLTEKRADKIIEDYRKGLRP